MLNSIPVVGWLLDFILKVSLAIPFYLIWTFFGIGGEYFYFLPEIYLNPGFWDCVGIFMVIPIIKTIFVPRLVYVSQTNNNENKDKDKDKDKDKE